MYLLLLALIYLAFISLGLPDSLLGSGWPVMHADLGVALSKMGLVSMTISCGTIVSSLVSDRMTHKFGTRIVTVASVFLTAFAMLGFSFSTRFWMLILFAVPYGLGAGCIDAALNNYVALHYSSKHMSWLHCFWGVGAIVSPYIMSYAIVNRSWSFGYRSVAVMQFIIGFILLATLSVWNVNRKTDLEQSEKPVLGLREVLRIPGVKSILIGFFAYCSAEATTMLWASSYLVEVRGIGKELAASFGALFYIGITAGRFLGGFVMNRFGDRRMISIGTLILCAGIICVVLPLETDMLAIIGFVVIGFGCAPIYPCIIHSAPDNFGADKSGAIIGIQMASAYIGSTFMPPVYGLIGKYLGLGIFPIYIAVFVMLMFFMTQRTFNVTGQINKSAAAN